MVKKIKTFNLFVYKDRRMLLSAILFIICPLFIIFTIPPRIDIPYFRWIIPLFLIIGLILALIYFTVSKVTVTFEDKKFIFEWKKKFIFNKKKILILSISDITGIVLNDQGERIQMILTRDGKLAMKCLKPNFIFKSDEQQFFSFLRNKIKKLEVKDIWDVWKEKGYLIWIFRINTVGLILLPLIVIIFGIIREVRPLNVVMLSSVFLRLVGYQFIMRRKIKGDY
ncbi:hypothetical protein [Capnocytophaga cynodegmi]|uniref:hypothetical protein n=1 Tax=Capnocytophaga cynodegmi TaxID=28189 RepID=UPI00385D93B9